MRPILAKTFGGLSRQYYLRQLFFGLAIAAVLFWFRTRVHVPAPGLVVWLAVNTLLYPYARFVWESVVGFVMGSNLFFLPALIVLGAKLLTMFLCWQFAVIIAPIGLGWLYWHHSRPSVDAP